MKTIDPLPNDHRERNDLKAADEIVELARQEVQRAGPGQQAALQAQNQQYSRPDPLADRTAYEEWYAQQPEWVQQSEWNRYHQTSRAQAAPAAQAPQTQPVATPLPLEAQSQLIPAKQQTPSPMTMPNQPAQEGTAEKPSKSHRKSHRRSSNYRNPFRSLITASFIAIIISFAFYNEIVIGQVRQYLSPSSTISTPIILDPNAAIDIGPEPRVIIPKINVDVPVVYDLGTLDEGAIQNALKDGVVDYEYPGTVQPGQIGNNVIVGHSSNNFLNSGKYKFAFVLLDRLEEGDTFILNYESQRYVYRVTNKQVIEPDDFNLITQPTSTPTTTLITCTPPGTSWRRLVIQGEQISPDASTAEVVKTPTTTEPVVDTPIPGNAPSLWSRIIDVF